MCSTQIYVQHVDLRVVRKSRTPPTRCCWLSKSDFKDVDDLHKPSLFFIHLHKTSPFFIQLHKPSLFFIHLYKPCLFINPNKTSIFFIHQSKHSLLFILLPQTRLFLIYTKSASALFIYTKSAFPLFINTNLPVIHQHKLIFPAIHLHKSVPFSVIIYTNAPLCLLYPSAQTHPLFTPFQVWPDIPIRRRYRLRRSSNVCCVSLVVISATLCWSLNAFAVVDPEEIRESVSPDTYVKTTPTRPVRVRMTPQIVNIS